MSFLHDSGTRATRRSPGAVSRGTTMCTSSTPPSANDHIRYHDRMTSSRRPLAFVVSLTVAASLLTMTSLSVGHAAAKLPARLTDLEFWQLSNDSSEPDGYFRSDNLTSNELGFLHVIPDLVTRTKPGEAYLGVGPEQNYTYMAATKPAMAIIFDIRRGNLVLQLMYKAVFELTKNRAEFVSMLFSRPRPDGLTAETSVSDLFDAFRSVPRDDTLYERNLNAIMDRLLRLHGMPLSGQETNALRQIYRTFSERGYAIRYSPTYSDLMTATDRSGAYRSYLTSEAAFNVVRNLELANLVVPVVGDFGGPKAIRAIGVYLKAHDATVGAFYLSNVEQYLAQDGKMTAFCRSVAALPLDATSTFIRTTSGRGGVGFGGNFVSSLGSMRD